MAATRGVSMANPLFVKLEIFRISVIVSQILALFKRKGKVSHDDADRRTENGKRRKF